LARAVGLLNARKVETLTETGRHADGGNLYLAISDNGGKRWVFMYTRDGKRREMGLGSAAKGQVSLATARVKAAEARQQLDAGLDPLDEKRRSDQPESEREIPTFGKFADQYIATHKSKFRNPKHIAQWEMTLKRYCQPIRRKPINLIDTDAVLSVLEPIWQSIPETASRLRGRLENIIDAAKAKGYYHGENPARWRGHLKALLPQRQKLSRGHHAALPYDDLPAFMAELRERSSLAALALELCILTATRTSEVLEATWDEFDLDKAVWIIPKHRMKAGVSHRIPLSGRAVEILKSLPRLEHNDHVFPGNKRGKPLSSMAMAMQLRRMNRHNITVHGFRSTFRDWAAEQTSFPHETCEHALAHRISDKAEAAYRRGDQFDKRRELMNAWADFACATGLGD
jgi:integrase